MMKTYMELILPLNLHIAITHFCASPEGRTGVSSYTGEGRHLGGIIGIPWPGSEAGLGFLTLRFSAPISAESNMVLT